MDSQSFDQPPETGDSRPGTEAEFVGIRQLPHRRGSALLAWIAIVTTIAIAVVPHFFGGKDESDEPSIMISEIQAKYLVGAASFSEMAKSTYQTEISNLFGRGPLRQRLIGIILQGELQGPEAAAKSLNELEAKIENDSIAAGAADRGIVTLLQKMQQSRIDTKDVESNLSVDERQTCHRLLPERLGWVGKLALLPPGAADQFGRSNLLSQANRTLFVVFGVFGLGVMATACGAVLQVVWWVFAAMGRLSSETGAIRGNHVIYAETFAVWMALFIALSYLISIPILSKFGLGMVLVPQIGGLAALAWPVFRGVRWADVCEDIGLRVGPQGWTVPFVGVGTYLSALPAVGAAMIVTLIMMAIASLFVGADDAVATPVHPIVEPILRGNWNVRLLLMFVAVFAAVPEEIMFRGVLYRHLREAGKTFGYVFSVVFAALISSFVFAAIHPQGLFGIPILMTLAIVFAVAREWRGSLIPSMIAHAMVNAGTTTVLFLIAS